MEKLEEIEVRFVLGTLYIDTLGNIENAREDPNCFIRNHELFVDGKSGLEVLVGVSSTKMFPKSHRPILTPTRTQIIFSM